MSSPTPLLAVRSLAYSYRGPGGAPQPAVRDASFEIAQGEIFGLLGPNGAGKTTTIACLSGLLHGWEGELLLRGKPFRPARNAADRAELGFVPQDLAVYEELSGAENLAFFAELTGLDRTAVNGAVERGLQLAGLKERATERVKAYSGGMKRRLNIAAGDLHEPSLLLLDEPTVGVDPQSRAYIFESLEALKERGRTLLYTTHYMEEAERLCDRIAIMNEGRIAGIGSAEELAMQAGIPGANLEKVFLALTGRSLRD